MNEEALNAKRYNKTDYGINTHARTIEPNANDPQQHVESKRTREREMAK